MRFVKNCFIVMLLMLLTGIFSSNCHAENARKSDLDVPIEIVKPFEAKNWTKTKIKFKVPTFGIEHQVRLALEVCAPYKKGKAGDGSNPVLDITINGNAISKKELLNKPPTFKWLGSQELTWSRNTSWRVLYADNFEIIPAYKKQYPNDPNPYRYVFDITKFVKSGQENEIVLDYRHVYTDITLKVRGLELMVSKKFMHPKLSEKIIPAPTGSLAKIEVRGKKIEPVKVYLADGGSIVVEMNNNEYQFNTRTTIPRGKWKATTVSNRKKYIARGSSNTIAWETPFYTIKRAVEVKDDHIMVSDTITNTTKELIGLQVENTLNCQDANAKYLLGGHEVAGNASYPECENPTACIQMKDSTIGLLPESDIFQAHINIFRQDKKVGIKDLNLGIQSGKTVTLKWSIYPVAKGGYWDFVNAIRRNWDVNYTVPGPFAFRSFGQMKRRTPEEYAKWIKDRNLKMLCDSIPVLNLPDRYKMAEKYGDKGRFTLYAHGTAAPQGTDFIANMEFIRDSIKKYYPDFEYFCYFHAQISTHEDGYQLYDDSVAYDGNGVPYSYMSKFLKMYVPTLTNKYGKALWAYVKLIVDELDVNMYWDEEAFSMQRMVYTKAWDGYTVVLNDDFTVAKKVTCVPLVMQPLKVKIAEYVKNRGKILLANCQAVTPTMRKHKILRFVENGSYDNMYKANLGCIIGLGTHHVVMTAEDAYDQAFNMLKRGGLYYTDFAIPVVPKNYFPQYMFPTTPIEIYERVILAKERIITSKAGAFALPGKVKAKKIVVIGSKGLVIPHEKMVKEVKTGDGYKYEVRIPSNYIAILIK